jgi:hypothetical protein
MDYSPAIVKADIGDERFVQIEARRTSPEEDVSIKQILSFDGVVDSIQAISERLSEALKTITPDKAAIEFGVDVGVESGALTALIVKGTGSATIKITLEWDSGSRADPSAARAGSG